MKFTFLSYALWLLTPFVQLFGLFLFCRRKFYLTLPMFLAYDVFVLWLTAAAFLIHKLGSASFYFYFWWSAEVIGVALSFLVIRELYRSLLEPYSSIREAAGTVLGWVLVLLAVAAVYVGSRSSDRSYVQFVNAITSFERIVRSVQLGLLLFLFAFAKACGLMWRPHTYGIALGFAVYSAVNVMVYTVRGLFGSYASSTLQTLPPMSYLLATVIWAWFFYVRDTSPRNKADSGRLSDWNAHLQKASDLI